MENTRENPVKLIRGELNRFQFAKKHGLSYVTLSLIETGTQDLGQKSAVKLAQISGRDPEELRKEFKQWRQEQSA